MASSTNADPALQTPMVILWEQQNASLVKATRFRISDQQHVAALVLIANTWQQLVNVFVSAATSPLTKLVERIPVSLTARESSILLALVTRSVISPESADPRLTVPLSAMEVLELSAKISESVNATTLFRLLRFVTLIAKSLLCKHPSLLRVKSESTIQSPKLKRLVSCPTRLVPQNAQKKIRLSAKLLVLDYPTAALSRAITTFHQRLRAATKCLLKSRERSHNAESQETSIKELITTSTLIICVATPHSLEMMVAVAFNSIRTLLST